MTRRTLTTSALAAAVAAALPKDASASHVGAFPDLIALPNGFRPEGVAIGSKPYAYFGSLADGDIYRVNLATGQGSIISEGPGTPSVGLKIDRRGRLFVAGGGAGNGRVVDARTGAVLASYSFATAPTFVNDVVLTPRGAYFTDSNNPALYRVPLDLGAFEPLPLTGALVYQEGFNVNGIAPTPDGRGLLVVQSNTALLFRVDPRTGVTTQVDLGDELLTNGDGLLVLGRTLYVVQNRLNTVAAFRLNSAGTRGTLITRVTDPRFDVPTTVAAFGRRLYLPNARFNTTPTPDTTYSVVAIPQF
ncbi:superoxide dismutase [Actinomycetes bacterium KLBMP 9797]